jgi:hypothetical protein
MQSWHDILKNLMIPMNLKTMGVRLMDFKPFRMLEREDAEMENTPLKVIHWYMTENAWEIYELDTGEESPNPDLIFTLTYGDFLEFGFHSKEEMKPYVISETSDLHEVNPPPGWRWVGIH